LGPAIRINAAPIVNTETDRVYVASRLGNVYCFNEIGSEFPTIHQVKEVLLDEKPLGRGKTTNALETPTDPAEASPSDVNDFPGFGDEPADVPATDDGDNPFDFGGVTNPVDEPPTNEPVDGGEIDMGMGDDEDPFNFDEN
jgi:hypothetical protein